ncbi:MAG: ATP-binding cassette domain-containing protein, partial [Lachnospiraceae bacterium]|nr:ATP-binding cassette domain-containing protein [Lachnospiraceae bacterium]
MECVLQTRALTKCFQHKVAVDHVNMNIPAGEIYGFIGRNGAGKTTLMRMILSLALPTEGDFQLFGEKASPRTARKIGALVETPALYTNCSARENLIRFGMLCGSDEKEADRILDLVGLTGSGSKKVGRFSLGMKQRLGIGIALLGQPSFIVLDEPVNGLDPAGIQEIRNLILHLNRDQGVSFLISSHLLDELGKIATRFGIISRGRLVEELSMQELNAKTEGKTRFVVDQPQEAERLLRQTLGDIPLLRQEHALLLPEGTADT